MIRFARIAGRLAVLALALAPAARAQRPCAQAVVQADSLYRDGRFADVEQRLGACLGGATPAPVAAYRLLTLSLVRQQRLAEAQETVLQLLVAYPDYAPDAVQDPPVYVSLVELVERQIARDRRPPPLEPPVLAEPPVPPVPAVSSAPVVPDLPADVPLSLPEPPRVSVLRMVWVEGLLGVESYDGERRQVGSGALGGFVDNSGPSVRAAVSVQVSQRIALDLRASLLRLPDLIRDGLPDGESGYPTDASGVLGFPVTTYPTLDASTTSRQVVSVAAALRAPLFPGRAVLPYVRAGVRAMLRRTSGTVRIGAGPDAALGVEAAVSTRAAVFGEATAALILPDRALDDAIFRSNGDLLLGVHVGFRYRLTPLR